MYLIFVCPESTSDFGASFKHILCGRKKIEKYKILLERVLDDLDVRAGVYIPETLGLFGQLKSIIKFLVWSVAHGTIFKWDNIFFRANRLPDESVIFISLRQGFRTGLLSAVDCRIRKVCFTSHYFIDTANILSNCEKFPPDRLVAEADISSNVFFSRFFNDYKDKLSVLPFALGSRFSNTCRFEDRDNRCFISGRVPDLTQTDDSHRDFKEVFPCARSYHEMRDALQFRHEELDEYLASKLLYNASGPNLTSPKGANFRENYYSSFNVVDCYNNYRMFMAPEEYTGAPTIAFVEGMACGCCLLAPDLVIYRSLGLKPFVHFLPYNGTVDGLIEKISEYQQKPKLVKRVAQDGEKYAIKMFSNEAVYWRFKRIIGSARNVN